MKKPKDPKIFLEHILDNIDKIEIDLFDLDEKSFSKDVTIQDATLRRLEVIGEAVKNLPLSFRKKHPKIFWKKMDSTKHLMIDLIISSRYMITQVKNIRF